MSNRLFHFSHLLAHCITNKETLWYPFIDEFNFYFPNLDSGVLRYYRVIKISGPIVKKFLRVISWVLPKVKLGKYCLNASSHEEIELSSIVKTGVFPLLFVRGWLIRDRQSVKNHKHILKFIFKFPQEVEVRLLHKLEKIRQKNSVLVGVHIRRGDYINHEGGKYFYSIECYSRFISHMKLLLEKESKHGVFVASSNDRDFAELLSSIHPDINYFSNDAISDLCMLSLCDYILGPPSTFSLWASFYGAVPVLHIETPLQIFELDDFTVFEG